MDYRIRQIADAFGRDEPRLCRDLAEELLDSTDDSDLRAEALVHVVQSHLARGEFSAAREAVERLAPVSAEEHQYWLARIERAKTSYLSAVGRLQRLISETTDANEAAWAQLLSGHLHQQAGLLGAAQESYWKVISRYPEHPLARSAVFQIGEMHRICGQPGDEATVYKLAVSVAPDSDLAVFACESIYRLCVVHKACSSEQARQHLQELAIAHACTRAGDRARFLIGQLYAEQGHLEDADRTWAALIAERPLSGIGCEARAQLGEFRYRLGTTAFAEADYERAIQWLARLLPDLVDLRAVAHRWHAVLCLGEAYQKLERWEAAAGTFGLLAVPGNPAEEVALFEVGRSLMKAGNGKGAAKAFGALKDRFPESAFIGRYEDDPDPRERQFGRPPSGLQQHAASGGRRSGADKEAVMARGDDGGVAVTSR